MISFCYILRDAEKQIGKSLKSALQAVPKQFDCEIICVIDSRTTDETRSICQNYGARCFIYEWKTDSFSDARNFGISKAVGDWIFVIDADETLNNFELPSDEYDYYFVNCINYLNGKPISIYPSARLFKNNIGIKFYDSRHEQLEKYLIGKKGNKSEIILRHKEKSLENIIEKTKWLLVKHLEQLKSEPDNKYLFGQIAFCYRTLEQWNECRDWSLFALMTDSIEPIRINGNLFFPNRSQLCNLLFECYVNLGEEDFAKRYLALSLIFCSQQVCANALTYDVYKNEDVIVAMAAKEKALQVGYNSLVPFDILPENLSFN